MACPVTGCTGSGHHFKKLSKYSAHFERFHKLNIFIFTCPIWNIKEARRSEFAMHIKKHHKCPRHISFEEVKNCKFIDRCDFKKPKKRYTMQKGRKQDWSEWIVYILKNHCLNFRITSTPVTIDTTTEDINNFKT